MQTLRRAVGVCALPPATRALLRRLSGRSRWVGAGWARLARGSMRPGKALRDDATRVPLLRLSRPTQAGARRVGFWSSAQLVKGAACVCVCLRRGAAVSGSARTCAARGGAGALRSGEQLACSRCLSIGACAAARRVTNPHGLTIGMKTLPLSAAFLLITVFFCGNFRGAVSQAPLSSATQITSQISTFANGYCLSLNCWSGSSSCTGPGMTYPCSQANSGGPGNNLQFQWTWWSDGTIRSSKWGNAGCLQAVPYTGSSSGHYQIVLTTCSSTDTTQQWGLSYNAASGYITSVAFGVCLTNVAAQSDAFYQAGTLDLGTCSGNAALWNYGITFQPLPSPPPPSPPPPPPSPLPPPSPPSPLASTPYGGSSSCNTATCSGCTSCAAAQSCASTYYCTGNQYVTNFQCSTVNGVGSWSATCAASATPSTTPSAASVAASYYDDKPFTTLFILLFVGAAVV